MSIVDFLHARLDEDEAAARRAADVVAVRTDIPPTLRLHDAATHESFDLEPAVMSVVAGQWLDNAVRHQPARVLRQVDAWRQIIHITEGVARERGGWDASRARQTLRYLAVAYAAHPDYDEAWRPGPGPLEV